jgi:hypothetical protein
MKHLLELKIAELEQAILNKHPSMATGLRDIHRTLLQHPENVTLLSPEEVGVLVRGLKLQTNTHIAVAAVKKSKTKSILSKFMVGGNLEL